MVIFYSYVSLPEGIHDLSMTFHGKSMDFPWICPWISVNPPSFRTTWWSAWTPPKASHHCVRPLKRRKRQGGDDGENPQLPQGTVYFGSYSYVFIIVTIVVIYLQLFIIAFIIVIYYSNKLQQLFIAMIMVDHVYVSPIQSSVLLYYTNYILYIMLQLYSIPMVILQDSYIIYNQ